MRPSLTRRHRTWPGSSWFPRPPARHTQVRFQVCYQDGKRHRSAGIFLTERRAVAEKRALERRDREVLPRLTEPDPAKAQTLFGEYVTTRWWPAWKDQHPASEYATRKKVEKRILPPFGDIPLGELDPSTIGRWKAAMVAEGLTARTVNTYLALLGTILNAAVDDDYLTRSPLLRKSGAGRTAATRNQPVPRREVWLVREQLDRLVEAIDPRYRALVLRWSWRVGYYTCSALGTDRYPPFTLAAADYPASLDVAYPQRLSRGLALVKWWLLAIPHYLVIAVFISGPGRWTTGSDGSGEQISQIGGGLIGILVLIAAVVLAFTGRYPQSLFDLVIGLNRWCYRVLAYAALMTDDYPPFRLDTGGSEPTGLPPAPLSPTERGRLATQPVPNRS